MVQTKTKNLLERLYTTYGTAMYRIAYQYLQNYALTEDALYNAFQYLCNRLGKIDDPDSLKTERYLLHLAAISAKTLAPNGIKTTQVTLKRVVFSKSFKRRMKILIHFHQRPYYRFINSKRKRLVVFVSSTLLLSIMCGLLLGTGTRRVLGNNSSSSIELSAESSMQPDESVDEVFATQNEPEPGPVQEEFTPRKEVSVALSCLVNDGFWTPFNGNLTADRIDALRIRTPNNKPYFITYKTRNQGKNDFYPALQSTVDDYAGNNGLAIEQVAIALSGSTDGVVLLYRVKAGNEWLPWVSSANEEDAKEILEQFTLEGTIDPNAFLTGIVGTQITGMEIRLFEEIDAASTVKLVEAPHIDQRSNWPTGCESVSAVMALQHTGFQITVDDFIDFYLDKSDFPFDPNLTYGGHPRSIGGFGCYAPVIKNALDEVLIGQDYAVKELHNQSLSSLCEQYIDNDIPVILWIAQNMSRIWISQSWTFEGRQIDWIAPEHCVLLVGYDDAHYIFNDPMKAQPQIYVKKSLVETAYTGMLSQAVAIVKN